MRDPAVVAPKDGHIGVFFYPSNFCAAVTFFLERNGATVPSPVRLFQLSSYVKGIPTRSRWDVSVVSATVDKRRLKS